MKKLIVMAVIALSAVTTLNAQTEKGKWVFGSDAGVSFASSTAKPEGLEYIDSETKNTVSTFEVNPNVGYFIIENLSIGLDLSFTSTKNKFENSEGDFDQTTNSIGILPNATYFFKKENLAPYLGAGVGLLATSSGDGDSQKTSGLAIAGTAGLAYFLNTSVSINFGATYLYSKQVNKENSNFKLNSNTIGVALGFAVYL